MGYKLVICYINFLWIIILVPIALYKSRFLDILNFGDEVSIGLGVSIEKKD